MAQKAYSSMASATAGQTTVSLSYNTLFGSNRFDAKVSATGNWNNEFETSQGGWGYNKQATTLVEYMNALSIPHDGLHHLTTSMLSDIAKYMDSHDEQEFVEDLVYLVRWDKVSNEVIMVLPTLRANYRCVVTYCRSVAHGDVSVDWLSDKSKVGAFDATNELHKASYDAIFGVFTDLYTNPYYGQVSRLVLKSKLLKAYTDIAWNEAHISHKAKEKGSISRKGC